MDKCWRCRQETGSLVHIWSCCPVLYDFGEKIYSEITTCMGIALELTPEACLLHLYLDRKDNVLLSNMLITVILLVAQKWKSLDAPTIDEWQSKCQHLLLMNKLSAIAKEWNGSKNAVLKFIWTWQKFINYGNAFKP